MGNFDNIPTELKEKNQWVLWRLEKKKGAVKPTKPPYSVHTGKKADKTNPDDWGTFEQCLTDFQGDGTHWDGIGYSFNAEDGIVGIDLDHCVNGGKLSKEAQHWVDIFGSYTEISPSGDGLHIFVRGKKPGEKCKKGDYEIYETDAYFTMTGNCLNGEVKPIRENQDAIDEFYNAVFGSKKVDADPLPGEPVDADPLPGEPVDADPLPGEPVDADPLPGDVIEFSSIVDEKELDTGEGEYRPTDDEVLDKAFNAKNGAEIKAIFNGGGIAGKSISEVDMVLMCLLKFYTQDPAQLERLFSMSARATMPHSNGEDKWNRVDGDGVYKYRQYLLEKAETTNKYEWTAPAPAPRKKRNLDEKTGKTGGDGKGISEGVASEEFVASMAGNLIYSQESFWEWDGKHWEEKIDKEIENKIRSFIKGKVGRSKVKAKLVKSVTYLVKLECLSETEFDQHKNLIALQNGVLNTETFEFFPHNRDYKQTILLPFNYDANAKAPRWMKFQDELEFKSDTWTRLQEWFGYCLVPDTRIEKCLLLLGDGGNGKGVILDTLGEMLAGNTASVEPISLAERFQLLGIRGKLVNYCTDISTREALSEVFKKIVSGEECTCDVKNKDHVTFKPFAKHLFSANNLPATRDRSEGFFRRFDVLWFNKTFDEKTRDEGLRDYLKDHELPGIFNWALAGLKRLRDQRWKLTPSIEFQSSHDDFRKSVNPLAQFVEENYHTVSLNDLEKSELPADEWREHLLKISVKTEEFREKYVGWCAKNGHMPLSENALGREVLRLKEFKAAGVKKERTSKDGNRYFVYLFVTPGEKI